MTGGPIPGPEPPVGSEHRTGTLAAAMQTRYLLIAAAITALTILAASAVWLVVTFS